MPEQEVIKQIKRRKTRLELDQETFTSFERPLAYEMINSLLVTTIELRQTFAMRPLEFEIFLVIAMASVQRFSARTPPRYGLS